MFRFGAETLLYAYLLLPALLALEWWAAARRRRALDRFGERGRIDRLTEMVSRRGQLTRAVLVLVAVVLLVTALARRSSAIRVETVRREGQDLVVALDLSASMEAEDIAPNRLAAARLAVGRLIERLDGDRIGLVAFAGEAFVQSPLTLDYAAATMFLNAMEPDLVPVPGTDLGQAIEVALDGFGEVGERARQLVVITDGEDHEGAIEAAIERAVDAGVRVHTVGMGSTEGGADSELRRDRRPERLPAGRGGERRHDASRRRRAAARGGQDRRRVLPRGRRVRGGVRAARRGADRR